MADIVGRDEKEAAIAKIIAKEFNRARLNLLHQIPLLDKWLRDVDPEFWNEHRGELTNKLTPALTSVFMEQAQTMLDDFPFLGVEWGVVNSQAAEWARQYAFDLVTKLNDVSRRTLQKVIPRFFEEQWNQGQLRDALAPIFGPVRAEMIARTEVTRAATEGEKELARELAEQGINMTPVWNTREDELVCPICGPKANKQIEGEDYPPAHPRCLPGNTLVLPIGGVSAGSKRWYEGDIVIIHTLEHTLSVTPNHPILTRRGWIGAGDLMQEDEVLCYGWGNYSIPVNRDEQHRISAIQDIFRTLGLRDFRVPVSPPDFHGDGSNSHIAIIRPNSEIDYRNETSTFKHTPDCPLVTGNIVPVVSLNSFGASNQSVPTSLDTPRGIMRGLDLARTLLLGHAAPFERFSLRLVPGSDMGSQQPEPYESTIDTEPFGDAVLALAGKVTTDKIINIERFSYSGHVYNLQTDSGLYVAAGIITQNCRCWTSHELIREEV